MSTIFSTDEPRKIRERRRALGMTQKQLADKIPCSPQLIAQIETCLKWQSIYRVKILKELGM